MPATYTEAEAIKLINAANNTNFTTFSDIENAIKAVPNPNDYLTKLSDKLTKQYTLETFRTKTLRFWESAFTGTNREQIEVGALAEIIGVGIPDVEDDVITKATDLLPNLSAIPPILVQNLLINLKKRVELIINKGVFERAMLNINAFNSFMGAYQGSSDKAITRFLYRQWMELIKIGIKRKITVGGAQGATLAEIFTEIFSTIGDETPFSQTFNLGWDGTTVDSAGLPLLPAKPATIPAGDSPNVYLTDQTVAKVNDILQEGKKFSDLNLVITGKLKRRYDTEVLSDIYHNEYLKLEEMFNEVIIVDKLTYLTKWGAKVDTNEMIAVIDKRAIFNAAAIVANKTQDWIKGEGEGIIQRVDSFWFILGIIPFMNGAMFNFKITTTPETTQADELPTDTFDITEDEIAQIKKTRLRKAKVEKKQKQNK